MVEWQQCQANEAEHLRVRGLLHPVEIFDANWESICIDFIIELPHTSKGHDAIWVMVDRLMKLARFLPTKTSVKATELAHYLV